MRPCELCISDAMAYLNKCELSSVEMIQSILEQIERAEKAVNAFITVRDADVMLLEARQLDERRARGEAVGRLAGIPVGLKDNFATSDLKTTAGSKILAEWHPGYDAKVVRKLKQEGAIIVGKLNMHEFADGTTTDNPHYGRTCNPWDLERTPAGSSGGSGAALAADMCLAATGTDTGGSIREPASFCGVVGLKPTFGLVSRAGVVPFSWSLDHVGPMGRRVSDVALLLEIMADPDDDDPASVRVPSGWLATVPKNLKGLTVGIETTFLTTQMQEGVRGTFRQCMDILTANGASIREVSIPSIRRCLDVELVILFSEAAVVHEKWLDASADEYGNDVRTSLLSGRLYKATDYVQAQRMRHVIRRETEAAFTQVDLLLTPTMIIEPPRWGTSAFVINGEDIDPLDAFIRCLIPANLAGYPAISVPAGYAESGLPVGMQFIGRHFAEAQLLAAAKAIEDATAAWKRKPNPGRWSAQ